jgi:hypothetical protein
VCAFTVRAFTVRVFTVRAFTVRAFTVRAFTVRAFTVRAFTVRVFTVPCVCRCRQQCVCGARGPTGPVGERPCGGCQQRQAGPGRGVGAAAHARPVRHHDRCRAAARPTRAPPDTTAQVCPQTHAHARKPCTALRVRGLCLPAAMLPSPSRRPGPPSPAPLRVLLSGAAVHARGLHSAAAEGRQACTCHLGDQGTARPRCWCAPRGGCRARGKGGSRVRLCCVRTHARMSALVCACSQDCPTRKVLGAEGGFSPLHHTHTVSESRTGVTHIPTPPHTPTCTPHCCRLPFLFIPLPPPRIRPPLARRRSWTA